MEELIDGVIINDERSMMIGLLIIIPCGGWGKDRFCDLREDNIAHKEKTIYGGDMRGAQKEDLDHGRHTPPRVFVARPTLLQKERRRRNFSIHSVGPRAGTLITEKQRIGRFETFSPSPHFEIAAETKNEANLPLCEKREQLSVGENPQGAEPDTAPGDKNLNILERAFNEQDFLTRRPTFESPLRSSAPIYRGWGTAAKQERYNKHTVHLHRGQIETIAPGGARGTWGKRLI